MLHVLLAFHFDDVLRNPQADDSIDASLALGVPVVVLHDRHVVPKKSNRLGSSVDNAVFVLRKLETKLAPEKGPDLLLDSFRFVTGSDETEENIVRISDVLEPTEARVNQHS
jgi:hypothetical protein